MLSAAYFSIYYKVLHSFVFSILWIVAQCSALTLGYFITTSLLDHSNGELLWDFFENWLEEKLDANEAIVRNMDMKNDSEQIRNLPWKGLPVNIRLLNRFQFYFCKFTFFNDS